MATATVPVQAKRTAPRDSQRGRLYKWERALPGWPGRTVDLVEAQALVTGWWLAYHGPLSSPPLVSDGRGRQSACGDRLRIALPRAARTQGYLAHEMAHSLTWVYLPPHGSTFVRVLIDLFADIDLGRKDDLLKSARAVGLRIGTSYASPRQRRTARRR